MAHALRHLIALLALATALLAQAPRTAEQPLHFTVFSSKALTGLAYTPKPGVPPVTMKFFPTARSPRYEYRGSMPLRFIDAAASGIVAEATVPPEIREALLLVSPIEPAPATGVKYRVAVLDDSALKNSAGGLVVINLSGLALAGKIDGKDVELKDGLNAPQAVGRTAKIALHATLKGRTYQAYAENLTLKKSERALLILFPPFYKGSLEVQSRMLVDEPPAATVPR